MKTDIRKKQLEGLLKLPRKEINRTAMMWQTKQFEQYMLEKYPVFVDRTHSAYIAWHYDCNTLRGACALYREFFGSELLEDYQRLISCDTDRITKKPAEEETSYMDHA